MKCPTRYIGGMIAAFGVGVILSTFIPPTLIIIFESVVIISAGIILFK